MYILSEWEKNIWLDWSYVTFWFPYQKLPLFNKSSVQIKFRGIVKNWLSSTIDCILCIYIQGNQDRKTQLPQTHPPDNTKGAISKKQLARILHAFSGLWCPKKSFRNRMLILSYFVWRIQILKIVCPMPE